MTDPTPTPTRAEVERYSPPFMFSTQRHGTMHLEASGQWVRFTDYQALRERAEAAESAHLSLCEAIGIPATALSHVEYAAQLTAARRAVAAAWNDAIEAAEAAYAQGFAAIRALRRADATEDRT